MAQALELPRRSEALQIPKGCTPLQVAGARCLLEAKPTDTWTDILTRAGYSPASVRSSALVLREASGFVRATKALVERQRDSAGEIDRLSAAAVLREVEKPNVDPSFALSSWATARKIRNEYPETQEGVSADDRASARATIFRYARIAARIAVYRALRTQHLVLSPQENAQPAK